MNEVAEKNVWLFVIVLTGKGEQEDLEEIQTCGRDTDSCICALVYS